MMKLLQTILLGVAFIAALPTFAADPENTLVIEVAGENEGTIEIELLPELAPNHVERVKVLARDGLYNNVAFHRVIEGFMAQTGDVTHGKIDGYLAQYAGQGGSNYPNLMAEFTGEPYREGIVGMARGQNENSANSQFFIMNKPDADKERATRINEFLTGKYTVLGRVISGQSVVNAIKLGNPEMNGSVFDAPDYMARVYIKADQADAQ